MKNPEPFFTDPRRVEFDLTPLVPRWRRIWWDVLTWVRRGR